MKRFCVILGMAALPLTLHAAAVDEEAARATLKQNNCFKCHSVDKKKDGPAFKETADKYRNKPDGVDKVYKHITTGPTVKIDDQEEKHKIMKGSDDEIHNVVNWILSTK